MQDEPTVPIPPAEPTAAAPATSSGGEPPAPPPPPAWHGPAAGGPNRVTRILGHRATGWFVAALLVGVVVGLAVALANTSSAPARAVVGAPALTPPPQALRVPANGRIGTFPGTRFVGGLVVGRVQSTSASSFTVATSSGSTVRVDEQSSTIYRRDGGATTKASVKKGDEVFVLGTRSGSTVKARSVAILANGAGSFYFPGGSSYFPG
jgi:hypothetical protein